MQSIEQRFMLFWHKHGTRLNLLTTFTNTITRRSFSISAKNNMKFIQFTRPGKPDDLRIGYIEGSCVIDINSRDSCIPKSLLGFLQNKAYMDRILEWKDRIPICQLPLKDVCLKAPIHGMDKILCIGLNYQDHCKQHKLKPPSVPMVFSKFASTIIGPNDPVLLRTDVTQQVDYEVELCAVIGKKTTCVPASEAYEHVFGFTIAQDISARDWQKEKNGGQFLLGKSMDTFCPIGPWIVTTDEIGDPEKLDISCSLNGFYKQSSNTKNLIHKIPDVIARLSSVMTLLPGDLILTGTPGGVGVYANPPEFLKPGDVLCSEIEKIGALRTPVERYELRKDVNLIVWGCDP